MYQYNRQHDSHHILPLDLDGEAIARCRLHPSRKNILYILAESNPSVIVYDTLKPSRPSKVVDLGSRAGIPFDLAFHSGGTHVCVVTTAGSLVTLNTGTWTTRVRELKVPLAAVAWVGPTEVAVGTETGELSPFAKAFAHTRSHPILCRSTSDPKRARREVRQRPRRG